jgi:hypothetical protein
MTTGKHTKLAGRWALKRAVPKDRGIDISSVFDLACQGPETNIARDKDQMVGDAVWQEHLSRIAQEPRTCTPED